MSKYEVTEVAMVFDDLEERTAKTISNLRTELQSLRAGRANPHILPRQSDRALLRRGYAH